MCLEKETLDITQRIHLTLLTTEATYRPPVRIEAQQSCRIVQMLPGFCSYNRGDNASHYCYLIDSDFTCHGSVADDSRLLYYFSITDREELIHLDRLSPLLEALTALLG